MAKNKQPLPPLPSYWDEWFEGERDELQVILDAAQEIKDQIAELEGQLAEQMEYAENYATGILRDVDADDCESERLNKPLVKLIIATQLYWKFDDKHIRRGLATGMGASVSRLPHLLYQIPAETKCSACGGHVELYISSRAELGPSYTYCEACQAKRDAEAAERDRAWKERAERDREVRLLLRSMPYADYLKTDHWQEVRKAAIKRAKFRCQTCNAAKPLQVHHRTYERRGEELATDVIALCADCHKTFHENGKLVRGES